MEACSGPGWVPRSCCAITSITVAALTCRKSWWGGPYRRHGIAVRLLYICAALVWHFIACRFARGAQRAVVLCYHGIRPHQPARFAWQVRRVAKRAIGVQELTASSTPSSASQNPARQCGAQRPTTCVVGSVGSSKGRSPAVCFTFDDAFANLLDNALPILRQHGVPACIFAVSDNLGDRPRWRIAPHHPDTDERTMTADELRQAVGDGLFTLGSHTCTHPDLAQLAPAEVLRELQDSRAKLADLVGRPVDDLALPHGSYTPAVLDAAFAAGYQRVHTLEPTPHTPCDGPQVIGRFLMSPDVWRIEFLLTCAGAYAWLHPWRRSLRRLRSWGRRLAPAAVSQQPVST